MTNIMLLVIILLGGAGIALLLRLLKKSARPDESLWPQRLDAFEKALERTERAVRDEVAHNREEQAKAAREQRQEAADGLRAFGESVTARLIEMAAAQERQLETMTRRLAQLSEANETRLEAVRQTLDGRLQSMQSDNAKQLDLMRQTVDEKLQGTLEKRLGESFRLVSERLEQVHKGLGEMQNLASGVGDLKKVLSNVKTRGIWGEVQLGMLLEQVLNPEQYEANVATKGGGERVEFAVRLPGQGDDRDQPLLLPIDAKFPLEDYQRLLDAQERGDSAAVEAAGKQLEARVKNCASDISAKYLNPPKTTDFAILFLPIEGLYAEVVRRSGLTDLLQREQRVVIAGPTTLWALLNSLQMGFRTLAIQQRSSEVWSLLGAVKTEWQKYGEVLDAVQKKLQQASEGLEKVKVRSRAVGRKLRDVQVLPSLDVAALLPGDVLAATDDDELPETES